jgi:recombinational DNA repair ATPase RecF
MEDVHNIIIGYNKTLEDLQEKYNEWEENNIKLQELKEIQVEEQKKYDCVLLAKKKLALAKQAMTVKYAEPILKSFSKYYEMISGNMANNFHVDANTTVTVDDFGKQREINTLSFGYRDLISICLRIALVDAMYQDEVPILIMDDPFANLDDEKVKASKKFIEKVSEKYQIIYFTCSNSRK